MKTYYTTASENYDAFGTTGEPTNFAVKSFGRDLQFIRRVKIQDEHENWQLGRYGSGGHLTCDQAGLEEHHKYGLVITL